MQLSRKWLDWRPPQKSQVGEGKELTKLTEPLKKGVSAEMTEGFVGSVSNSAYGVTPPKVCGNGGVPLAKGVSVGSVSNFAPSVTPMPELPVRLAIASREPWTDPAAWREPVAEWLHTDCVRHRRCSGSVTILHRVYSEWEVADGNPPCSRGMFEQLLRKMGFTVVEGFVSGLILRSDFDGVRAYPSIGRLLN